MFQRLDVAIEHRSVALDAKSVRRAMHIEPLGRRALVGAYLLADGLVENLGTATRDGLRTEQNDSSY